MSNQTDTKNYATELYIEDLGRVTGGTAIGGSQPTTMTLVGTESGNSPTGGMTTAIAGEEGGQPKLPNLPNFPNLPNLTGCFGETIGGPITQMVGEGGGGPVGKL
jgi:hypothetical protein